MSTQAQVSPAAKAGQPASAPIRVAYLIDFFGGGGGTENQLALLINNLDKTKFEPYLYTMRSVHLDNKLPVSCPVKQLNVTSLASISALKAIWQLAAELRKKRIDILQLFFIDANILGVLAGKLAGIQNIIISRRDMGWWYSESRRKVTNVLNRFTQYCIANAQAIKNIVTQYEHFPADRIEVIYNGLTAQSAPQTSFSRATLGIPEAVPIVGIVANLKPIKRLDRFIQVAAKISHPKAHFLIVGYGSEQPALTEIARKLGIVERVHFYYTADHIFDVMRLFSVGALTSDSEGLSNVLVEYAFCGVPAVAFDTGGNKEAIIDGKTGFVIPAYDTNTMAAQIDALLSDPEAARKISEEANRSAKERFSVERMIQDTQSFYRRITNVTK